MIPTHLYNLKVEFLDGHKWDLDIEAVDASWLFTWINDKQASKVKMFNINLLRKNYSTEKDNFGARSLKSNI